MNETLNLVLLTHTFPYGIGEAFLVEEIKTISKLFSKVVILSRAPFNLSQEYEVPPNVEIIRVCKSPQRYLLRDVLTCLSSLSCWKELLFVRRCFGYSFVLSFKRIVTGYIATKRIFLPYLQKFDVKNTIFYSYWTNGLAYALACLKDHKPGAFCFSRSHNYDNFIERGNSFFRRLIVDRLDAIYPISLVGKKEFEEKIFPFCSTRNLNVKVFHLGVDTSYKKDCQTSCESSVFNVTSCSFIHKIKRLDIIIDALSLINDFPIHWVHLGGGVDEKAIRLLAQKKLGSKKNITFTFVGQTDHKDVLRYYEENHIDLFVNSSDLEGIPVSMMEAMARSIPCVARNVGGIAELLEDGSGFLLKANAEGSDFAQIIRYVHECSEEEKKTLRSKARKKIESQFSSSLVYNEFINNVLDSLNQNTRNNDSIEKIITEK